MQSANLSPRFGPACPPKLKDTGNKLTKSTAREAQALINWARRVCPDRDRMFDISKTDAAHFERWIDTFMNVFDACQTRVRSLQCLKGLFRLSQVFACSDCRHSRLVRGRINSIADNEFAQLTSLMQMVMVP